MTKPVFIHISKNAGYSILAAAGDKIISAGHRIAESWIAEHGRSAPTFAVIRNPFDRVLSEYCFRLHRFEGGETNAHLTNLDKPFDHWVRSTFRDGEFRTRSFFEATEIPYGARNMVGDCLIWFIPQTRWIGIGATEILVDELLRYDHLEHDWLQFSNSYGIEGHLEHRNCSRRERDYRPHYSSESLKIVRNYYAEDFDAFDFV
ncbi:MAG: hypothetical protein HOC23_23990 [Halieaceae bacterium]|jgi:hypothetical protein|nr:hypothetical protein [Halieaceae bacterium]